MIKGNAGEIMTIDKLTSGYVSSTASDAAMRGVDSLASLSEKNSLECATRVSCDFQCIVVVTGKVN